jgi:hypothetical protein
MAGLRKKGDSFVLCFRVGEALYNRAVGSDRDVATATKRRVEAFLLELKRGRRRLPVGLTREQHRTSSTSCSCKESAVVHMSFRRQRDRPKRH